MNKILSSLIVSSLLVLTPALASAQVTASTSASVQAMLLQIQTLQTQIQALQTAQNNIKGTLTLLRQLKQGMSGDDVKALQAILAADPSIYPEGVVSGYFGRLTSEAVKKFQKKHGLEAVGSVGPRTLQKLNEDKDDLGLDQEDNNDQGQNGRMNASSTEKRLCAKIPPGHMIAPGWLKHNDNERPIVPECQKLPQGIMNKLPGFGSTTPPTGTTTPPGIDVTPPVIFSITTQQGSTTASVNWITNELSFSKVWFGTTSPLNLASATSVLNGSLVTSHSVMLTGLSTSTTYFFVVGSADASANLSTSSQSSFTTTAN